jgi:uncharacterized protein
MEKHPDILIKNIVFPLVPYIAIGLGIGLCRNVWIGVIIYHAMIVLALWLTHPPLSVKKIFYSKNIQLPLVSALVCACAGIALYFLWPYLSISSDLNPFLQSIGLNSRSWPFFMVYFIIFNPLLEELYWRIYLGSNKKRLTLNDLFFAGYHILIMAGFMQLALLVLVFLCLTFAAWFWRQINRLSLGFLPSIIGHLAADASIIYTIYHMTI